jgi:hypothetical protein
MYLALNRRPNNYQWILSVGEKFQIELQNIFIFLKPTIDAIITKQTAESLNYKFEQHIARRMFDLHAG